MEMTFYNYEYKNMLGVAYYGSFLFRKSTNNFGRIIILKE
jgi:hypothetical protein